MAMIKNLTFAPLFLLLAGCSGGIMGGPKTVAPVDVTQLPSMRVASYAVVVPETLTVSEENSYRPNADIVWRGDPIGPRHPQVKAIFEEGVEKGTKDLDGSVPVALDIVVQQFHSQSEKVRYSFGGMYEIGYELTVRNATSGEIIIPTYRVYTEIDAPAGIEALAADQAGRTEKIDNIALIGNSVHTQLTGTDMFGNAAQ